MTWFGAGRTEPGGQDSVPGRRSVARVTRRALMATGAALAWADPVNAGSAFDGIARQARLAIVLARRNLRFPFGAVIMRAADGGLLPEGVNDALHNPVLHSEIVCMNAYVAPHGNAGWDAAVLYTTANHA